MFSAGNQIEEEVLPLDADHEEAIPRRFASRNSGRKGRLQKQMRLLLTLAPRESK